MRDGKYELDLVLRNNLTTEEHPLGLYHPHAELHHIKKENIGLIEVMGLAVLPARLKEELAAVADSLVSGSDLRAGALTEKHADWRDSRQNILSHGKMPWTLSRGRPDWSLPRYWSMPECISGPTRAERLS